MSNGSKVVVAMSGGVDSSVAAALLVRQGYDVVGITIKTYRYEDVGGNLLNETSCCSLDGINDARSVASTLGFPHYVLDFSERFEEEVITPFVNEYLAGRTPNPCVLCNRSIKWDELLKKAHALGATAIATGHYARVLSDSRGMRFWIGKGRDARKDQSYALWGLTQESLSRTMFPLADLTKEEVRAIAVEDGLSIARKGESFEICFIPDNRYDRFLAERVPSLAGMSGDVVRDGTVVGKHKGYPFYTIGQRRGIGIATGEPMYVTGVDPARNIVTVGPDSALYQRGCIAKSVNLMKHIRPPDGHRVLAKVRYHDEGAMAVVRTRDDGRMMVEFDEPRRAITPGQSIALYEGDELIGGGIIDEVLPGRNST